MQKECKFGRKEYVGDGEKKAQIQHTFLLRLFTSLPPRELRTAYSQSQATEHKV
jgi:hypothetical protein